MRKPECDRLSNDTEFSELESPVWDHNEHEKPLKPSKLLLAILYFGAFLGNTDETFVLTTARQIAGSFGEGSSSVWLITGYNLGYSMALPIYGRLYEVMGQQKTFLLAYTLYGVGCGVSAIKPFYLVVFGRFLAGLGGSGMMDLASVALNDIAGPREVAVLRGYLMVCALLGSVAGSPLGGFLTSVLGWRVAFLVHIPCVLICALATLFKLRPESRHSSDSKIPEADHGNCHENTTSSRPSLDIPGITALSATIFTFILFVQLISNSDWTGRGIAMKVGLGVAFVVCVTSFTVIEVYWASNPVIPFHLLRSTQVGLLWGTTFFLMMSNFSFNSTIGPYFGRVCGFNTTQRGLSLAPLALGAAAGAVLTGHVVKRTGRPMPWAIAGVIVNIFSLIVILLRWSIFRPSVPEILYSVPFGFGTGMSLSAQFTTLSISIPENYAPTAITSYYLFQQAGIMIGIAVTQPFQDLIFRQSLGVELGTNPEKKKMIEKIMGGSAYSRSLPESLHDLIDSLFRRSFLLVPAFGMVVSSFALLLIIWQKLLRSNDIQ